uniref:Delta-like protein n=1 Tax=Mesocestoides corti TaxID=53468 RepID=A0A5K3EW64_MESCO
MAKTTITELCNVPLLILAILVRSSPSQSLLGYAAIGTLEIIYSNPENILQNRHVCDLLPHDRACDVYFEICFSSEYGECDIFQYRSKIFKDSSNVRIVGDSAIIMFLKSPLPVS